MDIDVAPATATDPAGNGTEAPSAPARRRSRASRVWGIIDMSAWAVAIVGAIGVAIAVQVFGFQITRVLSPSMVPTFDPGDMVIIRPVTTTDLQVGDIPMLPDADDPESQYVHRIIQTSARGSEVWVVTQGDANQAPDAPKTIVSEQVPVVVATIPLSKIPTIALSWNLALGLLVVAVVGLLLAMFLPSRKGDDEESRP